MAQFVKFSTPSLSFQNEHVIYENEVRCIVRESDYNLSYNPSLLKYGPQPLIKVVSSLETEFISSTPGFGDIYYYFAKNVFTYIGDNNRDIEILYNIYVDGPSGPQNFPVLIPAIIPAGQTTITTKIFFDLDIVSVGSPPPTNAIVYPSTIFPSSQLYEVLDSTVKDFATGSAFQPYVTTIGLYNNNNDLLMVAKLSKPIALSSDTDMTFIVRYDT